MDWNWGDLNYIAIIVSVIAGQVFGALWFSPLLFANAWMDAIGTTKEEIQARPGPMAVPFAISIGAAIVVAFVIAHLLQQLDDPGIEDGLLIGGILGLGVFAAMDAIYVADGHHRSAAASVVHQRHVDSDARHAADAPCGRFLTVTFPEDQVRILPYNRAVRDLNGLNAEGFLARAGETHSVEPCPGAPGPDEAGVVDVYVGGAWHRLTARPGVTPDDPVGGLDVAVLQERVLGPILGIGDPRTDERIAFVGGIRGTGELERLVDSGDYAVAFAMCATPVSGLLAVADSGNVMPPKSTWFEPKLRSGLFVQALDCTPAGQAYTG